MNFSFPEALAKAGGEFLERSRLWLREKLTDFGPWLWELIKNIGIGIWGLFSCLIGEVAYFFTWLYGFVLRPGDKIELSRNAMSILSPFFPGLDFDEITVRTGAKFIVPKGDSLGLTIRKTVYLKIENFDECNLEHMELLMHELVHVVQYDLMGWWTYACVYGLQTGLYGYWDNPLEQQAFDFIDRNHFNIMEAIENTCGFVRRDESLNLAISPGSWFWLTWDSA